MKIQELLRRNNTPYEILKHPADTSLMKLAEERKISCSELAQVTLLRANHGYRYMLAVTPPQRPLDLHFATRALDGCALEPASPQEQADFCPDCEAGRLMPFGSHYNVRTLLDEALANEASIAFEEVDGGETIRIMTADFCEIEHPFVVPLTRQSCEQVSR